MAEWSKALVLGTSLFGDVGSNPTLVRPHFCGGMAAVVLWSGLLECIGSTTTKKLKTLYA